MVLPYDEVDVNSHPAKREVRFHQDGKVYSTLQRAVRSALVATAPVPNMGADLSGSGRGAASPSFSAPNETPGFFRSPFDSRPFTRSFNQSLSGAGGAAADSDAGIAGAGPPDAALTPQQALPALRVVGQVRLTYIVAESPDGMYLVDQHAAHERVVFDRIVRRAAQREVQSQPLLAPVTVELTPGQLATLESHREFLAAYGYELEHFGERSYSGAGGAGYSDHPGPGQVVTGCAGFGGLLRGCCGSGRTYWPPRLLATAPSAPDSQ